MKEVLRLFSTKHYAFNKKVTKLQSTNTEIYLRIPWERVVDPLRSTEYTLETSVIRLKGIANCEASGIQRSGLATVLCYS